MITKLHLQNENQKVLWVELQGQLSDGMWENSSPWEHWRDWCHFDLEVVVDGTLGYEGYARKHNYNFTNPSLIKSCGKDWRERVAANIQWPGIGRVDNWHLKVAWEDNDEYSRELRARLESFGVKEGDECNVGLYSVSQLKADLKAIKVAVRTRL